MATSRARPGTKGRVESDVAEEAARQTWAARELLLRLGFAPECIGVKCGVPLGAETDKRIEDRMLQACVELVVLDGQLKRRMFQITCAPVPSAAIFVDAMKRRALAIQGGVYTEAELLRAYKASAAYEGRHEIVVALVNKGFPVPQEWERAITPDGAPERAKAPN